MSYTQVVVDCQVTKLQCKESFLSLGWGRGGGGEEWEEIEGESNVERMNRH